MANESLPDLAGSQPSRILNSFWSRVASVMDGNADRSAPAALAGRPGFAPLEGCKTALKPPIEKYSLPSEWRPG